MQMGRWNVLRSRVVGMCKQVCVADNQVQGPRPVRTGGDGLMGVVCARALCKAV